jgi:hypothetical protein
MDTDVIVQICILVLLQYTVARYSLEAHKSRRKLTF